MNYSKLFKYFFLSLTIFPYVTQGKEAQNFTPDEMKKIREVSGFDAYLSKQREMNFEDAKTRWSRVTFNADKFKNASWKERAPMAVDLLKSKNLMIGKSKDEIIKLLGRHDGFFWRDHIPAYIIEDGLETGKDSWQVVFFYGMDHKISDIRIYENK